MNGFMLDSNGVSGILRLDKQLLARFQEAQRYGDPVLLSPLVEYEIRRGLLHRDAKNLAARFDKLSGKLQTVKYDRSAWLRAASLWAYTRAIGAPIEDKDLLIAAHALDLGAILVTRNVRHFAVFQPLGLRLDDWQAPDRMETSR